MEKWFVAPSYKHAEIKKIDEENHKAYIKEECPRCSGLGIIVSRVENGKMIPVPVDGGVCYQCNGDKYIYKWVKAYTEKEYARYTRNQERAKERRVEKEKARIAELDAKADENKAIWLTIWVSILLDRLSIWLAETHMKSKIGLKNAAAAITPL